MSHKSPIRNFAFGLVALIAIPGLIAQTGVDYEINKNQIVEMSPEKKSELQRKKEEFDRLPDFEKDRIREFHRNFSSLPPKQREHLLMVLRDYHEWLKELTSKERAELRGMPITDRIEEIKRLRNEQHQKNFGMVGDTRLPDEDLEALSQWVTGIGQAKREKIVELLQKRGGFRGGRRQREMIGLLRFTEEDFRSIVSESDIEQLKENLSPSAIKILEVDDTYERQAVLVQRWIGAAMMSRYQLKVSDEELQRFYDTALPSDVREKLDRLSPRNWRRQLKFLYLRNQQVSDGRLETFYKDKLTDEQREYIDQVSGQERKNRLMREYIKSRESSRFGGSGRGDRGGSRERGSNPPGGGQRRAPDFLPLPS